MAKNQRQHVSFNLQSPSRNQQGQNDKTPLSTPDDIGFYPLVAVGRDLDAVSAMKSYASELSEELRARLNSAGKNNGITTYSEIWVLVESLSDPVPDIRLASAMVIKRGIEMSLGRHMPIWSDFLHAVPRLISLLSDENIGVQSEAVNTLCAFAKKPGEGTPQFNSELIAALKEHSLVVHKPGSLVLPAIDALQACGTGLASRACAQLVGLLKHAEPEVCRKAIAVLDWLESDAAPAFDPLVEFVGRGRLSLENRTAAVEVLTKFDPIGDRLAGNQKLDAESRDSILEALEHCDDRGQALRHKLRAAWKCCEERTKESARGSITAKEYQCLLAIKRDIDPDDTYIGSSVAILRVFEGIRKLNRILASNKSTKVPSVLILGETGVGKTEIAKFIHTSSNRDTGPFQTQHATAVMGADENIVRQNWVGYGTNVRGLPNFNPKEANGGIIQKNAGGSIFFDELHGTPEWFRTFLLQILDGQPIPFPYGEGDPVKPNVRMIFASNKSRDELDNLQGDLFRRLRGAIVEVPDLKSRKEDIGEFITKHCPGYRPDYQFLLALVLYDWPGNVGQLLAILDTATSNATPEDAGDENVGVQAETEKTKAKTNSSATKKPDEVDAKKRNAITRPLTLDCLKGTEVDTIAQVRALSDEDAERELYLFLIDAFTKQGFRKRNGIQRQIASFMRVGDSTVSKRIQHLGLKERLDRQ